jgi:hypothetical protein
MKKCQKCGEEKELDAFGRHPEGKDGMQSQCYVCISIGTKQWRKDNPEKWKAMRDRYNNHPDGIFQHCRASARTYKRDWQITIEQIYFFVSEGCFITGCKDRVTGLDRIDCSIDYVFSNVRPSCARHNEMRNDMTDEEYIRKCEEVVAWSKL